ncbi:hypothetical protein [Sinorhizobium prairiense]|uniref:hypothetical protein n=2 Tax=Sinorhizobium TaxID=28105 RepID=UPI0023D83220|nr:MULTISPECIES: hypothetical protein [unclassified Sinorhizobium]WEJ17555.1 hypothetical protein N0Q91_20235 [Sinorhizobium sp. K101]WEJ40492.1 hypothetical protein N0R80_27890 [Sinorhizobium sp. C101]
MATAGGAALRGHIERLIGTQMGKLHLLPGTTFSNAQELGEYDSKRHSALTLRELERYIALDIVGSYHQSIHSSLGRPPVAVWREHENEIPLRLPQDRMRFWPAGTWSVSSCGDPRATSWKLAMPI